MPSDETLSGPGPEALAGRAIKILERLVAFDTTSRGSNLALIEYVEGRLAERKWAICFCCCHEVLRSGCSIHPLRRSASMSCCISRGS